MKRTDKLDKNTNSTSESKQRRPSIRVFDEPQRYIESDQKPVFDDVFEYETT
jgi:hypothetical protein